MARIFHADLFGTRDEKYNSLLENDISTTQWTELSPSAPFYLFVPQNTDLRAEYEQGWNVTDVMPVNAIGLNSHRDAFAVAFDASTLNTRVEDLASINLPDKEIKDKYDLVDTHDFSLSQARTSLQLLNDIESIVIPCLYRPFDHRFLLYHPEILDRPRTELNVHFVKRDNLGLVTTRQTREPFAVLVVDRVCGQHKIVAAYDGSSIFPLYLYPNNKKQPLFNTDTPTDAPGGRRPNLNPAFIADMEQRLGMTFVPDGKGNLQATFSPEDIFNYMYAIFHSPTYRARYAEFLKIDFPRLPLTSDPSLFRNLCDLGSRLVALHLMEQQGPASSMPAFNVKGSNTVEKVLYTDPTPEAERGRVYINKEQYFDGIPQQVWDFHIGGYRVAEKWLKDRKGRALTYEDVVHYRRTIAALSETIRLMREIDAAIPAWPIT